MALHPAQVIEQDGEDLLVRFRAGGLREVAAHVFTWGGEVVIEGPEALKKIMRERLTAGAGAVEMRPELA